MPWFLKSERRGNGADVDKLDAALLDGSAADVPLAGDVGLFVAVSCHYTHPGADSDARILLEYGHGLFEDYEAPGRWGWTADIANEAVAALWAVNWRGMSRFDILDATGILMWNNDRIENFMAGLTQAFATKVAAQRIVRLILAADDGKEHFDTKGLEPNPAALPARYMGVSLGSILGGGYVPFMQYERSVLLIGGSCFSFIFGRSYLFTFYRVVMDQQYYTRADLRLAMTSWQVIVGSFEASGWHTGDSSSPAPWASLQVLQQIANGDSTVSSISGRIQARTINATLLGPALFDVYGLDEVDGPVSTTGDVPSSETKFLFNTEFKKAAKSIPESSALPPQTEAHLCLPQNPFVVLQAGTFLSTGEVVSHAPYCDGVSSVCDIDQGVQDDWCNGLV